MNVIKVQSTISMGHRLPSYKGMCSSPHGHNVTIEARVFTTEFFDFKLLKGFLDFIVDQMDHAMVLVEGDPLIDFLDKNNFRCVVLSEEPSTENIAAYIFARMRNSLDSFGAKGILQCIIVHETDKYSATALDDGRLQDVRCVRVFGD